MVGFRNAVGSAPMTNWVSPQSQRIAFGRGYFRYFYCLLLDVDWHFSFWGAIGYVAINNEDSVWKASFSTSLPDGKYCDVISGTGSSGKCTGTMCVILARSWIFFWHYYISITVAKGSFMGSIPARGAVAIHTAVVANLLLWPSNKLDQHKYCQCQWVHCSSYFSSIFIGILLH